jgi:lysophospholipid acyltransferase (LPLAT)-like uncharacterized protein
MIKKILFYIGYFYFLLIIKTCKTTIVGRESVESEFALGEKLVFCCPHNFLLGLFAGIENGKLKRTRITVVASLSSDGELIAKLLQKFRFDMVRGSSNRGGKKALLELTRAGKSGKSLGLAFDGPKGPPLIPKRGLIGCARANNGFVYLIYGNAEASKLFPFMKPFRVNSWDRFLIPVPFCHITVNFEKVPPFTNTENQNLTTTELKAKEEEHILQFIEKRSKEIFGYLY